jgi:hypothetical protein
MVSKNRIGNHAMNLLAAVATYREDDNTVSLSSLRLKHGLILSERPSDLSCVP